MRFNPSIRKHFDNRKLSRNLTASNLFLDRPRFTECRAWGDPHVITFDGANNDVYGVATYVLAQSSEDAVANNGTQVTNWGPLCRLWIVEGISYCESLMMSNQLFL